MGDTETWTEEGKGKHEGKVFHYELDHYPDGTPKKRHVKTVVERYKKTIDYTYDDYGRKTFMYTETPSRSTIHKFIKNNPVLQQTFIHKTDSNTGFKNQTWKKYEYGGVTVDASMDHTRKRVGGTVGHFGFDRNNNIYPKRPNFNKPSNYYHKKRRFN